MDPAAVVSVGDKFRSMSDQVYSALLEAIAERRIKPGERLVLDDLALQLKVSRTPIRDALSRLAGEGLVQPAGTRGFCVTRLDAVQLDHLYDLRVMCETYAIEVGIAHVTPELLLRMDELARSNARMDDPVDHSGELARRLADREFHLLIVGLGRNPELLALFKRLNIHIHALRAGPTLETLAERTEINLTEHAAIISALRQGDAAEARQLARSHILNAKHRLMASLGATTSS